MLAQNLDAALQCQDDAKCKALFSALGILEDFTKSDTPKLSVVTTAGHPTHWIAGALLSGYSLPEQNGYLVICLPKSKTPPEKLNEAVEEIYRIYGGQDRQDSVKHRPDDWQKLN